MIKDELESVAGKLVTFKLSVISANLLSSALDKTHVPINITNRVNTIIYAKESSIASTITMESLAQ